MITQFSLTDRFGVPISTITDAQMSYVRAHLADIGDFDGAESMYNASLVLTRLGEHSAAELLLKIAGEMAFPSLTHEASLYVRSGSAGDFSFAGRHLIIRATYISHCTATYGLANSIDGAHAQAVATALPRSGTTTALVPLKWTKHNPTIHSGE